MQNRCFGLSVGVVCMLVLGAAADPKEAAIQKDRQRIEGKWKITALTVNGSQAAEEDIRKFLVVNGSDGTWSLRVDDNEITGGTSTFDPTQKPKTIDFTPNRGQSAGEHFRGIYELGENERKLCFAPPGAERPSEFSSTAENRHILVHFQREEGK